MDFNSEKLDIAIQNYIHDTTYDYAIMINGAWGCGKTYFIHNKVINYLKSYRPYVYISLYGIKSTEDITKQIYIQNYFGNKKGEDISELTSFVTSVAYDLLEQKGIKISKLEKTLKNKLPIKRNTVLIFDDLERSTIPIIQLLGYINGFVEHQHLKVIVVANEKEINRNVENLEMKYLIASKLIKDKKIKDDEIVTYLNEKVSQLFDERSEYDRIKEKLFGESYDYVPDLENSCKDILKRLRTDYQFYYDILNKYISDFCTMMKETQHTNLRTFQFFLSKMIALAKKLNLEQNEYKINLFESYLLKSLEECIAFKNGEGIKNTLGSTELMLAEYIRGNTFLDDDFIKVMYIMFRINQSDEEYDKRLNGFLSWATKNAKDTKENFNYIVNNSSKIELTYLGQILYNCSKLQYMKVLEEKDIIEFIKKVKKNKRNHADLKINYFKTLAVMLDRDEEREIYRMYIRELMSVENEDIYNPFEYWLLKKEEKYLNFKDTDVMDAIYLDDVLLQEIYNSIFEETTAQRLWDLRDLLSKVYSQYNVENTFYIKSNENREALKKLCEEVESKLNNDNITDPILIYAINGIVLQLQKINNFFSFNANSKKDEI